MSFLLKFFGRGRRERKIDQENQPPKVESIPVPCPYCGFDLVTLPKRKRKCPSCSQPVYIKYTPGNRTKRLMTQQEADESEKQWESHGNRQLLLSHVSPLGYVESDIEATIAQGAENDREAVQMLARKATRTSNDINQIKFGNLILALYAAQDDKPFRHYLTQARRRDLLSYKMADVVKKIEICNANARDICPVCQENAGKVYDLEDALRILPLPCEGCTCRAFKQRGYCDCWYATVLPESSEG